MIPPAWDETAFFSWANPVSYTIVDETRQQPAGPYASWEHAGDAMNFSRF